MPGKKYYLSTMAMMKKSQTGYKNVNRNEI